MRNEMDFVNTCNGYCCCLLTPNLKQESGLQIFEKEKEKEASRFDPTKNAAPIHTT
jgi:hypothetical protein